MTFFANCHSQFSRRNWLIVVFERRFKNVTFQTKQGFGRPDICWLFEHLRMNEYFSLSHYLYFQPKNSKTNYQRRQDLKHLEFQTDRHEIVILLKLNFCHFFRGRVQNLVKIVMWHVNLDFIREYKKSHRSTRTNNKRFYSHNLTSDGKIKSVLVRLLSLLIINLGEARAVYISHVFGIGKYTEAFELMV